MSAAIQHLSSAEFEHEVLQASVPVVVDLWAPWCGPCRMLAPELEKAAEQLGAQAKVVKINVDENPGIAGQFGVMGIPTILIFKQGKEVGRHVGFIKADALIASLKSHIGG